MKSTVSKILFLLFSFIFAQAVLADDDRDSPWKSNTRFYQTLLDSAGSFGLPGVALTINGGGETFTGTAGYANLQSGQLWTPDMPFFPGSTGKAFIAVVILQLWQEGKLDLDDTLNKRLPVAISDQLVGADIITIRQLLNHSSGMVDVLNDIPDAFAAFIQETGRVWTDEEAITYAFGHPLHFEPGSQYRYSNTGYILLAMIIKQVTGEHAAVAVRSRILDPLDMQHTWYQTQETGYAELVHGYLLQGGEAHDTQPWVSTIGLGAAPIATTTGDLARFLRAIFKDRRLLSHRARKEMLKYNLIATEEPFSQYGFALVKTDWGKNHLYEHSGGIAGYQAQMAYFPQHDLVITGFTNVTYADSVADPAGLFYNYLLSTIMGRVAGSGDDDEDGRRHRR